MGRLLVGISIACGISAGASSARASVAWLESVEGLASRCDAVVRGRVVATEARLSGDGRRISTYATVRRSELLRGAAPSQFEVRIPGGTMGDLGQRVQGAPTLRAGDDVVLFLFRTGPTSPSLRSGRGSSPFTAALRSRSWTALRGSVRGSRRATGPSRRCRSPSSSAE